MFNVDLFICIQKYITLNAGNSKFKKYINVGMRFVELFVEMCMCIPTAWNELKLFVVVHKLSLILNHTEDGNVQFSENIIKQ